jgi:hypothetical protein
MGEVDMRLFTIYFLVEVDLKEYRLPFEIFDAYIILWTEHLQEFREVVWLGSMLYKIPNSVLVYVKGQVNTEAINFLQNEMGIDCFPIEKNLLLPKNKNKLKQCLQVILEL